MLPTITKSPIALAIIELQRYRREHRARANVLVCGPDSYYELRSVGYDYLQLDKDLEWTLDGARLEMREGVTGYTPELR